MIVTRNSTCIAAGARAIYDLVSRTDAWPKYLPHYRSVTVLHAEGNAQVVEMAARRGLIPVRWTAEQRNDPVAPAIAFHHLKGWTRGMDVRWIFEPVEEGLTAVTIEHRLRFLFPVAADFLGRYVVSGYFIHGIAGRTLACFKRMLEKS